MAAQLCSTVYVTDPDTRQTVVLAPGTSPEPRLAALVTNPVAWVDGKLPRLPKAQTQSKPGPTGDGPDDASGADSGPPDGPDQLPQGDDQAAPAAKKTAAKKAAPRPARGRDAAGEGSSGE